MMKYCLFLEEVASDTTNTDQIGHKAHKLAELLRVGLRVPQAFCISTSGYNLHLATNHLDEPIRQILNSEDISEAQKAKQIQEIICTAPMPNELRQEILQAYAKLAKNRVDNFPVAVRSSGTAEDLPNHSFAGQYATFLEVSGEGALVEKTKACWASLWSERAFSYRSQVPADLLKMAVIVQQLVPAKSAGVAFSANPLNGQDEIILEAVAGLGEGLVSGTQTPEYYRLEKQENGDFTAPQPEPILSVNQLVNLRSLIITIENHFGQPQDIEWAYAEGNFYVLQSRPITILPQGQPQSTLEDTNLERLLARAKDTGCLIWTKDNVGEVIPGVVTPLSWSVIEPLGNNAFRSFLRRAGIPFTTETSLFARFEGQVFFNLSQLQQTLRFFYFSQRLKGDQHLGSARKLTQKSGVIFQLIGTGLRILLLFVRLPIEAKKLQRTIPEEIGKSTQGKTETLPVQLERITYWRELDQRVMNTHVPVTVMAMLLYSLLEKLLQRWTGSETEISYLMTGLPGMKSAEPGHDLQKIAQKIYQDQPLRDCILGTEPAALNAWFASLEPQSEFKQQIQSFLDKHGHASLREFELAFPSWREDLSFVLIAVQNLLREQANGPNARSVQRLHEQRQQTTQTVRTQLGFGLRRLIFEILLPLTQNYSIIRENVKYTFVMAHSHLRGEYLSLARLLQIQQKLSKVDHLFYLTDNELNRLVMRNFKIEMFDPRIQERKIELTEAKKDQFLAPSVIVENVDGSLEYVEAGEIPRDSAATLKGVPASAGCVRGKARVILDPLEATFLEKDEILVAPSTNPAWSPLFLQASGLITEIGGTLSHGAILAREYNLPAVLNVENATHIIKNGQSLLIDGTAGTVTILENSPNHA